MKRIQLASLCLLAFPQIVSAEDKSGYHLLRPVPDSLMRELSTDRPDKTESSYTVDAGHFQIEADLVSWTRDRSQGTTALDALGIGTMNIKAGLTNSLDFQAVVETYHYERTRTGVQRQTDDGFGDVTLRAKLNLWGNDGGRTAFGIMPFVTLPTARGGFGAARTEGGIILPLAVKLAGGWDLGMMTEVDFVSEDNGGRRTSVINSVTLGHDLTERLGMYLEFFSEIPSKNTDAWVGTVDVGFTFALTKNIQLDAGANVGVTKAADDLNTFLGFTFRS